MPAIPVYSASPITAAKASGTTPQTAAAHPGNGQASAALQQQQPMNTSSGTNETQRYPAAQPAARPSQPEPTGMPQPANASYHAQPTATTTQPSSVISSGPPPPQPGARPVPPGAAPASTTMSGGSKLPPPPKAGETAQQYQTGQMGHTGAAVTPMPPQVSIPPPQVPFGAQQGTSTTAAAGVPRPTTLQTGGGLQGYQQDTNALEFNSYQRAAHNASVAEQSSTGIITTPISGGDDEGVWDTAKKWAAAAGESLAAAEGEVWKRINKD